MKTIGKKILALTLLFLLESSALVVNAKGIDIEKMAGAGDSMTVLYKNGDLATGNFEIKNIYKGYTQKYSIIANNVVDFETSNGNDSLANAYILILKNDKTLEIYLPSNGITAVVSKNVRKIVDQHMYITDDNEMIEVAVSGLRYDDTVDDIRFEFNTVATNVKSLEQNNVRHASSNHWAKGVYIDQNNSAIYFNADTRDDEMVYTKLFDNVYSVFANDYQFFILALDGSFYGVNKKDLEQGKKPMVYKYLDNVPLSKDAFSALDYPPAVIDNNNALYTIDYSSETPVKQIAGNVKEQLFNGIFATLDGTLLVLRGTGAFGYKEPIKQDDVFRYYNFKDLLEKCGIQPYDDEKIVDYCAHHEYTFLTNKNRLINIHKRNFDAYAVVIDENVSSIIYQNEGFIVYKTLNNDVKCNYFEWTATMHSYAFMLPIGNKKTAVYYNGKELALDYQVQLKDGRSFYPFRQCLEALGASVMWDARNSIASGILDNARVDFQLGNNTYKVNNIERQMDVAPYIDEKLNATFVPLRYAAEGLGFKVEWQEGEIEDKILLTK